MIWNSELHSDDSKGISTRGLLNNGVASEIDFAELCALPEINEKVFSMTRAPTEEEINSLDPMYVSYIVHPWMKYPKFGHAVATDYASRFVRYGMMSREEAVELVKEREGKFDPKCVDNFCQFVGYSETEFWDIVNNFYNTDIFKRNELGEWVLKEPIK